MGFPYCYMINVLVSAESISCKRGYLHSGIARLKSESYALFLVIQDYVG